MRNVRSRLTFHPSLLRLLAGSLPLLLLAVLTGCDAVGGPFWRGDDTPEPTPRDRVQVRPGLEVTLKTPRAVAPADSFAVEVTVDNQTGRSVTVTTPDAALADLGVFRDDSRVSMNGSLRFVPQVVTEHSIPSGSHTTAYGLEATRDDPEGERPVASGTYTARITLHWTLEGRTLERTLEGSFRVQASE